MTDQTSQVNPADWDPKRVARYYAKHVSPAKSPILEKLVLDNNLNGQALLYTPRDILSQ
jgi:hypothetical protein